MAAWMARDGRPARPKSAGLCGCLIVLATIYATSYRAHAEGGVIYVNVPHGYSSIDLGSDLRQSLAEKFSYTLAEADSDQAVLERVAADPRNIGFVQRDHYVQYLRDHGDSTARFEFYGNIPACLMAVVRKGTQIQTYGDLVRTRADRPTTLDVGPKSGQLAATFENLRQMDGSLGQLVLQYRGGARALGQVITGETDAALFLALAPFTDGFVAELINGEALDLVPGASGVTTIRSTGDNNTSTVTFPAGNTFSFYGTTYTSLIVSTNGLITFGSANTSAANSEVTLLISIPRRVNFASCLLNIGFSSFQEKSN